MKTSTAKKIGFRGLGTFGDKFAKQAGIISARFESAQKKDELEQAAQELGADLTDPEHFRIVQSLTSK